MKTNERYMLTPQTHSKQNGFIKKKFIDIRSNLNFNNKQGVFFSYFYYYSGT